MQWNSSIIIIVLAVILTLALIYMIFRRDKTSENFEPPPPPPSPKEAPENEPGYSMVLFHLNGCGPCKQVRPEWDKLKNQVSMGSPGVQFYEIEASHPEVQKFGIKGFPTIKFFKGTPSPEKPAIDYTGERTAEGLLKFVNEMVK